MKGKTLSFQSARLLSHLNTQRQQFFTVKDAQTILFDSNKGTVGELLRSMVTRGLLLRIKDGLYNIIPYESDAKVYFPNLHQTAQAIMQPKQYYIGFYSALDLHGLITQPSMIEYVVSFERILPKRHEIGQATFEFVTLNKNHFFGFKNQWIDDFNKVSYSDLEKTIIDCLFIPRYAGGISEIIKAIYKGRNDISTDKLYTYLEQFNVQVVNKRLGYLLQHLDLFSDFRKDLLSTIRDGYTPLEPSLPKDGHHYSTWKIQDNIDVATALTTLNT